MHPKNRIDFRFIGALVQLVRMPACHAGGHEFESRTHRQQTVKFFYRFGALVQLVRMPACHAGGHEFESRTHRFQCSDSVQRYCLKNFNKGCALLLGTSFFYSTFHLISLRITNFSEDNSVRIAINASLTGENKRQAYPIFGQITKNTTIILVHMEKIKGFLFAVRHREILMTDLG